MTSYQYDTLGRITTMTLPGGNTIQTAFASSVVTVTDQVNRKIKRETDGLGRLIKVTEQDATGALAQETSYSYDIADNLVLVNQGGQTRAFKYDTAGRLIYERIPEQAATINDGSGTYWSCKYTYTEWGAMATKQDARGVVTTYSYDTLHRNSGISYNTTNAPGVAATPTVTYTYDTNQSSATNGLLLSAGVGSTYSESYGYDTNKRMSSLTRVMDSQSYVTSYQYNTANQMTQISYPMGSRVMSISHDSKGRVSAVADQYRSYVGSIAYDGIGRLSSYSRGNGVVESYGYDTNRMQMTSQTAVLGGNTLMNLNYSYNALAAQSGAGTTAGDAGQLMSISGSINGTTESAAYTYDNVRRLMTSNQTSNGASAQRRFAYDRWGNRTGVWDAVTGGAQIQSVAIEQSGGAATNRIESINGARTNVALASNGATATASSTTPESEGIGTFPASSVINGDHKGLNWANGGGWRDATESQYPDWIQVDFSASKSIDEIDVFAVQDNYSNPSEPTEAMTFSQYGITDYQVQYWDGAVWQTVPGGSISGNNKVWRKVKFAPITTSKIRVNVTGALSGRSRVIEVEAYASMYDAAGNVINDGSHTYTYDGENRVVAVDGGATASYSYDHQNRRYKKVAGGASTHYVWQGDEVIAEHNASNGAVLMNYVSAGGKLIASMGSGVLKWYVSDRLSVRLTLDANNNVVGQQGHLPFGEEIGSSGTTDKHKMTSYERDSETGTDYAMNRGYLSAVGRFMQADPYKASGYMVDPQSWNRYSYTQNDPINYLDMAGLIRSRWTEPSMSTMPGASIEAPGSSAGVISDDSSIGVLLGGEGGGEADEQRTTRERITKLINEIIPNASEALKNKDCNDFLSSVSGDAQIALALLEVNGGISYDPGKVEEAAKKAGKDPADVAGLTECPPGQSCAVFIGGPAFSPDIGGFFGTRTPEEGLLLVLLHEIGHVTRRTSAEKDALVDTPQFNKDLLDKCIAPLRKNKKKP